MKKYRIWAQLIVDGDVADHVDYDTDNEHLKDLWDDFAGSLKMIKKHIQSSKESESE